ncbi:hemin receptor [Acinetobacter sp. WZC-1]|uniref:hemin receptor n=1 Tax=Acinetobacter sp. WZC-1 TaxID=3459034 RepID=UPI00403D637A
MNQANPSIGPHEGIELKLMLDGKKNLALFYSDYEIPNEFHKYIENKELFLNKFQFQTKFKNLFIDFFIISKIGNDENIFKLSNLIKRSIEESEFNPEIERSIGRLLGYQEVDIEHFIHQKMGRRENKKYYFFYPYGFVAQGLCNKAGLQAPVSIRP